MSLPAGFGALLAVGLLLISPIASEPLRAQGFRGKVVLTGSGLELRGLVRDSIPEGQVPGDGSRRRLPDGTVVYCSPGAFCTWYRSGPVQSVSVFTQDVTAAAWVGVRGLSGHVHLRTRLGGNEFWPFSQQKFTALAAYLSYNQTKYRIRAGRLFRTNALGYYNFDGASFMWRGWQPLRLTVFGGWSPAPNVNAGYESNVFEAAEDIPPGKNALVFGGELGAHFGRTVTLGAVYQRVIATDRLGLYSERVAADARALLGTIVVNASAAYDLAYTQFNDARLQVRAPVGRAVDVNLLFRHYSPFFELWSIWGAFSPVGFNEAEATVGWRIGRTGLRVEGGGAYRNYGDTNNELSFTYIKTYGWRAFGRAQWARRGWFADLAYRAETGFGAVRYGGDIRVGRDFGTGTYVALRGQSTQNILETRLGEQFATGGGVEGAVAVRDFTLTANAGLYRIDYKNRPTMRDWTQPRLFLAVSYAFGTEPTAPSRRGGASY